MKTTNISLPNFDESIKVNEEQINEFREKGHILLRNIISKDEVNIYRDVIINAANYYGVKYAGHNLMRANNQSILLERFLEKELVLTS